MITKGTKIRLVKKMGVFDSIGEVCEVMSVSEDGVISFRFGGFHLGCMSYSEFEKYFEYAEEDTEKRELLSLFEWCKKHDKPFYPELYNNIIKSTAIQIIQYWEYIRRECPLGNIGTEHLKILISAK